MITGELKNKIDGLWDIFAAGGLVNPLEVIEQITYLMFIHDLDDVDNIRAKESVLLGLPYQSIFSEEVKIGERTLDGSQLKWSVFRDFPADRMYSVMQEWVFPFIKTLHSDKNSAYSKYMDDAIFKLPTPLVLSKVVDSLDEIYKMMNEIQTADVRGDVYEYLLSKIAQSGRNGQFRTPRHIIQMMVEMMNPSSDEVICDPACGTSGFLVAAGEYLKEKKKELEKSKDFSVTVLEQFLEKLELLCEELSKRTKEAKKIVQKRSQERDHARDAAAKASKLLKSFVQLEDAEKTLQSLKSRKKRSQNSRNWQFGSKTPGRYRQFISDFWTARKCWKN